SLGKAFQLWFEWESPYDDTLWPYGDRYDCNNDVTWFYGMTILGDPTLYVNRSVEHNVGVHALDVPSHVENGTICVNVTVVNNGNHSEDVIVKLFINGTENDNATLSFGKGENNWNESNVSFIWTPSASEEYVVTINVSIPGGTEDFYVDNERNQTVIVGVLNNDTDECFDTIQEAIDDPNTVDGHSILVPQGVYHENLMVNKNLSLIGVNRDTTIIDGDGSGAVVNVSADRVNISGFTIWNGTCGVYLDSSSNVVIVGNNVSNNIVAGVYLDSS
ncbi:unnamed protein product, partial [marine sediment metagenome]